MKARNIKAELEFPFDDQRADVVAWTPNDKPIAFEFQHSNISITEIRRRVELYKQKRIMQLWFPFLRDRKLKEYPIWPFEKFLYNLYRRREMWFWCPQQMQFSCFRFGDVRRYVEVSEWYEDGEHRCEGGYEYSSRRYKELQMLIELVPIDLIRILPKYPFADLMLWKGEER